MKRISWILLLGVAATLALMPGYAGNWKKNKSAGRYVSQPMEQLPAFENVVISGEVEVAFMQRPEYSLHVSGKEKSARAVTTQVEGGVLHIVSTAANGHPARVALTAPQLNNVTLSGNGELRVHGSLHTAQLALTLQDESEFSADDVTVQSLHIRASGRSEADINRLDAKQVNAQTAGKAEIELSGLALEVFFENNGAGEIDGADLRVHTGTAIVKDKGDICIAAYQSLTAQALGKGKIKYKDRPVSFHPVGDTRRIVQDLDD